MIQPNQSYAQTGSVTWTSGTAPSDRQSIVKEYEWAITEMQQVVDEFTVRLQPVLRPISVADERSEPMPTLSEARVRLHDLQTTIGTLRSILDRLEV